MCSSARRYQPHYEVYEADIKNNCRKIREAFQSVPISFAYSIKTNSIPAVVDEMYGLGFLAEATSDIEVGIALSVGVPYCDIIYNGPAKGDLANDVLENGGIVVFDSVDDYKRVRSVGRCMFRVAVNIENDHGPIDTRFGIKPEELKDAISTAIHDGYDVVGIHCHVTDGRTIDGWRQKLESMLSVYSSVRDMLSDKIVDMGGNMYSPMPLEMRGEFVDTIGYYEYGSLFNEYSKMFDGAKFIIEMGTSVISNCMTYKTSVIGIKNTDSNTYVLLDATNYSLGWSSKRINHACSIEHVGGQQQEVKSAKFVGRLCTEDDCFHRGYDGEIGVGDIVTFYNVGSYTVSIKPPFIMPQDPVYLICEDWSKRLVKRAETLDDVLSTYMV